MIIYVLHPPKKDIKFKVLYLSPKKQTKQTDLNNKAGSNKMYDYSYTNNLILFSIEYLIML